MTRLATFLAVLVFAGAAAAADCAPGRVDLRGPWGAARFSVEVADTAEARAQGLMFRDSLAASQGMLFIYDTPGAPSFWMKNTLIPLDMLFFTPDGRVQHVRHMAQPGDLRPSGGGPGVLMVLEIRGGLAAALGIAAGTEMRHPSLDPKLAAWPCDAPVLTQ